MKFKYKGVEFIAESWTLALSMVKKIDTSTDEEVTSKADCLKVGVKQIE